MQDTTNQGEEIHENAPPFSDLTVDPNWIGASKNGKASVQDIVQIERRKGEVGGDKKNISVDELCGGKEG